MALYLGSNKVAGNTTSESLNNDLKNYKVTFDDSGTIGESENFTSIMGEIKSKGLMSGILCGVKKALNFLNNALENIQTTITGINGSLNEFDSKLNSTTTKIDNRLKNINFFNVSKNVYMASFPVDNSTSRYIKISTGNGYNNLTGIIFTRYSVYAFSITCSNTGKYSEPEISKLVGTSTSTPLTTSVTDGVACFQIGTWESFTMIFNSHGNIAPTITCTSTL